MNQRSEEPAERLPRPIARVLERQNRRLERMESKLDRILDLLQKIDARLDAEIDEFEEFEDFDEELEDPADIDAISKELENLSPEELKAQLVWFIAIAKAGSQDEEGEPSAGGPR